MDIGGIAKGHAVDRAVGSLKARGIKRAIVSAGGDRQGRPWMVGMRGPGREKEMAAVLPLSDTAVSTSGDYERYFEFDGVRYHHNY